jgi:CBS domain
MITREIMQTRFHTLSPRDTIAETVNHFQTPIDDDHKKVFGLMVTDENDHLVGILSMYGILLFIQPKHVHIWGEMEDIDPTEWYDEHLEKVKSILAGDIMTTEVVTITPGYPSDGYRRHYDQKTYSPAAGRRQSGSYGHRFCFRCLSSFAE